MKLCIIPFVFAGFAAVIAFSPVSAQIRTHQYPTKIKYDIPWLSTLSSGNKWHLPGLNPDKQITNKQQNPYLTQLANTSLSGDYFWLGSVTQQSYNQGKIGRYYYWDVQGNLRGSYLFLDIAGKNKRGLKLVFPRQKALF